MVLVLLRSNVSLLPIVEHVRYFVLEAEDVSS